MMRGWTTISCVGVSNRDALLGLFYRRLGERIGFCRESFARKWVDFFRWVSFVRLGQLSESRPDVESWPNHGAAPVQGPHL